MNLRALDAFPKKERTQTDMSLPGVVVSNGMILLFLLVLWLRTTAWMGAHQDYEFSVYKGIQDTFTVNLDITVASSCSDLDVFVVDAAEDRLLVNELIQFISIEDPSGPWCRMGGIFDTNRVKGTLAFTQRSRTFFGRGGGTANFTHGIAELSFGPYYPSMLNPLDETFKLAETNADYFVYYLNIVPTTLRAFGTSAETNLYSVTEAGGKNGVMPPGIYFEFDFDPIAMIIRDSRMSFFQWLFRLANIVGGIAIATSWGLGVFEKSAPEKLHGLLDP